MAHTPDKYIKSEPEWLANWRRKHNITFIRAGEIIGWFRVRYGRGNNLANTPMDMYQFFVLTTLLLNTIFPGSSIRTAIILAAIFPVVLYKLGKFDHEHLHSQQQESKIDGAWQHLPHLEQLEALKKIEAKLGIEHTEIIKGKKYKRFDEM